MQDLDEIDTQVNFMIFTFSRMCNVENPKKRFVKPNDFSLRLTYKASFFTCVFNRGFSGAKK